MTTKHLFARHATGGPRWLVLKTISPSLFGYKEAMCECVRVNKKGRKYYNVFRVQELVFEN